MIFKNGKNSIRLKHRCFLNEYKIGSGIIESVKIDRFLLPGEPSAIDKYKEKCIMKLYSELLERRRIGIVTFQSDKLGVYDIIQKKIMYVNKKEFGYVYDGKFGTLDTTGVASGKASTPIITKAVEELFEKNELMLFWYRQLGRKIIKNKELEIFLNKKGIYDIDKLHLYYINNLSSIHTILVIITDTKGNLIATGINGNFSLERALENAIQEAKLFECIYYKADYDIYAKLSHEVYTSICEYIGRLDASITTVDFFHLLNKTTPKDEFNIYNFDVSIENLYVCFLNNKLNGEAKTVRCLSPQLLNCIPTYNNILSSPKQKIIESYSIIETFNEIPECIVV